MIGVIGRTGGEIKAACIATNNSGVCCQRHQRRNLASNSGLKRQPLFISSGNIHGHQYLIVTSSASLSAAGGRRNQPGNNVDVSLSGQQRRSRKPAA